MFLNKIAPAEGSKKLKTRVGRGIGSNFGKTCGRGHKGQKSRSGGFHKTGFEGGQMPIQRRLPKRGFVANSEKTASFRSSIFNGFSESLITKELLIDKGFITNRIKKVKIYKTENLEKKISTKGIKVSVGMKKAIEMNGGSHL